MKNKFVSVIIPTFNRKEILKRTIQGLREQMFPLDRFEIIIIDDGSNDGTREMLQDTISPELEIRYLYQQNKGPAAARNKGIKNSTGDILLFIGDDCIPHPCLIDEHVKSHKRENFVAILGHVDWHPELEITPFMEYINQGAQFNFAAISDPQNVNFNFFVTSNISIKKEVLSKDCAFDEEFSYAAYEDTELAYRLWIKGIKIIYNSNAIVYHWHNVDLKSFALRQKKAGKMAVILYKKHPELKEMLGINNVSNPEFALRFYEGLVNYFYFSGIKEELMNVEKSSKDNSWDWLQEEYKGWQEKLMLELLRNLMTKEYELRKIRQSKAYQLYSKIRKFVEKNKLTMIIWNKIKERMLY